MLLAQQAFARSEHLGRCQGLELPIVERSGLDILGAVGQVLLQGAAAGALVFLGIGPAAQEVCLQFCQHGLVRLRVTKLILIGFQGIGEVFAQARNRDDGGVAAHTEGLRTSEAVHARRESIQAVFVRAQVAQIVRGNLQHRVVVRAAVVAETQRGNVVLHILLIQQRQALEVAHGHVFFKVHKHRVDGSRLTGGNGCQERRSFPASGTHWPRPRHRPW